MQTRRRVLSALHLAMVVTRTRSFGTTAKKDVSTPIGSIAATAEILLKEAGILHTETKAGWCLKEGLIHILSADDGRMIPVIQKHGAPKMYDSLKEHCRHTPPEKKEGDDVLKPGNCFQSLCRIVAGQQLAGAAALAMYKRLISITDNDLNPEIILKLADQGFEEHLRSPAGLSNAKARSIVALAQAYHDEELSEDFLQSAPEPEIREALLKIKGIGPWSCDMFLMFVMEHADVLPIGDLGVRSGMTKFFSLKGTGKAGYLCQKKDLKKIEKAMAPFEPYRSLAAYYMWRVADTKDVYNATKSSAPSSSSSSSSSSKDPALSTPKKKSPKTKKRKATP